MTRSNRQVSRTTPARSEPGIESRSAVYAACRQEHAACRPWWAAVALACFALASLGIWQGSASSVSKLVWDDATESDYGWVPAGQWVPVTYQQQMDNPKTDGASQASATQDSAKQQNGEMVDQADTGGQEQKPKVRFDLGKKRDSGPVKRARRPQMAADSRPFFDDFYREALVGSPPDWSSLGESSKTSGAGKAGSTASTTESVAGGFEALISAAVIEDEIKKAATLLTTQITTPVRFRSDYRDVHQTYSQLAVIFAINEAYGSDVRWHDDAAAFRELMGKTAAGTRVSTPQAYQMAVQSRDELQQIVRGGRASVAASGDPLEDWSTVVDRTPMMTWLEQLTQEDMKAKASNENLIQKNREELNAEAELVAAIAEILLQPGLDDADDSDYIKHAQAMKAAALEVKSSLELENYQGVQDAINAINQSCDDCHGDFR